MVGRGFCSEDKEGSHVRCGKAEVHGDLLWHRSSRRVSIQSSLALHKTVQFDHE